jgi:hypothetical protein
LERYKQKQRKKRQRQYVIIGAIALIVIVIVAYALLVQPPSYPARTPSPPLDGVPTIGSTTTLAEHIHVHLDIYINGTPYVIPADLGHISDGVLLYALHTHDTTGLIHIEAPPPANQNFTIGQLFEVYGWPLDSNHIFDKVGPVSLYVNNGNTPITFDVNYVMHAHDEIVLVYGTPPTTIPSTYAFPTGS